MGERGEVHDGARLERDLALECDVAVIGTGAGGGTAAEILAQAGLKVVMIEAGAYLTARDFTLHESQAYPDLYQEAAGRKSKNKAITILQGRAVGGSTTVNWTTCFRTPEPTLARWREAHGLEDYTPAALAPWFGMMEKRLNIHTWTEYPPNENNQALLRGARRLGWQAGVIRRNVRDCIDLGYCGLGCPVAAAQSMVVTTVPGALAEGAVLVTRVRAERLDIRGDRVRAVEGVALDPTGLNPTGRAVRVEAARFVLAGGGIDGPALLLRSGAPDPYRRLGRRVFLHLVNASGALMPERVDGFYGAPQSIYCDEFLWRDGAGGRCGYKLEVPPLYPAISMAAAKDHGPWSARIARRFSHIHSIIALMRDGFHPDSPGGVVELRDDGSPVLDYRLTDYLRDGLRRAFLSMAECQFAAGARRVFPFHHDRPPAGYRSWREAREGIRDLPIEALRLTLFSAHVMGGCAMGARAEQAVVDPEGRHHQLANLYVFDGSIFPTSIGANPQLSIYGIVARNATRLAAATGDSRRG